MYELKIYRRILCHDNKNDGNLKGDWLASAQLTWGICTSTCKFTLALAFTFALAHYKFSL